MKDDHNREPRPMMSQADVDKLIYPLLDTFNSWKVLAFRIIVALLIDLRNCLVDINETLREKGVEK
jgi:hypothetical protein